MALPLFKQASLKPSQATQPSRRQGDRSSPGSYVELILSEGQDNSFLLPMLSQVCHAEDLMPSAQDKWCALVNAPASFSKHSLLQANVNLDRILQVKQNPRNNINSGDIDSPAIQLAEHGNCSTIVCWTSTKNIGAQKRLEYLAKKNNCQIISIRYRNN